MKKELREEIRQDEFATGIDQAMAWAARNRDPLRIGVLVALALAAAFAAYVHFRDQRLQEADRALREALTTFEAPLTAELPAGSEPPQGVVFATAEEKYKTAASAFEGVARRYPSSAAGVRAKYFGALSRMELAQYTEAETALKELQARGAGLEPDLARLALADLYKRKGELDKAVEAYRSFASNPAASLPRDQALMRAAEALEDARRYVEARAAYRELIEQFPASVFAAAARSRVEYLQTAS